MARGLGVHVNLIYNWKRELSEDPDFASPGHGKLKPADEELRRLKRELEDVKEERDIFKKALPFSLNRPNVWTSLH